MANTKNNLKLFEERPSNAETTSADESSKLISSSSSLCVGDERGEGRDIHSLQRCLLSSNAVGIRGSLSFFLY